MIINNSIREKYMRFSLYLLVLIGIILIWIIYDGISNNNESFIDENFLLMIVLLLIVGIITLSRTLLGY